MTKTIDYRLISVHFLSARAANPVTDTLYIQYKSTMGVYNYSGCRNITAMAKSSSRTFSDAVAALNTLISDKKGAPKSDAPSMDDAERLAHWEAQFHLTFRQFKLLDLEEPVSRLSIIHVAGTKGKGSTCAFTERILRESGFKTGLFTSPHLLNVRERFRLNGKEVPEEVFTKNFWWCWDRLQAYVKDGIPMPRFFRFMTLLALKMFITEKVDVAILEVGLGGRFDATNIVKRPTVCGITSLGYDHMDVLGKTLAEIASQKAGIFKAGVPAITAPQPAEAMEALRKRARQLAISLEVAPPLESYKVENLKLGLGGDHQRINAALAIALCRTWAMRSGHERHKTMIEEAMRKGSLPTTYIEGLSKTFWPGRAQIIHDTKLCKPGKLSFYLDGAHSPESMDACAKWFCSTASSKSKVNGIKGQEASAYILLFNCMSKRDPQQLLPPLLNTCTKQGILIQAAFFVPPYSSYNAIDAYNKVDADLSWQKLLQQQWEAMQQSYRNKGSLFKAESTTPIIGSLKNGLKPDSGLYKGCNVGPTSAVLPSLPAALDWLRLFARQNPGIHLQVLVTGSLYLVGDLLKILNGNQLAM